MINDKGGKRKSERKSAVCANRTGVDGLGRHGEAVMNIVDVLLGAVYEIRPDIAPSDENLLLHGDLYCHVEKTIGDIIQVRIDENVEFMHNLTEEVGVHTDGDTLWVNSTSRCEVRIAGLRHLNGMRDAKAVMYKSDNIKDVMILGD